MANGVLIIGWNYPRSGLEQQALELFHTSIQYFATMQKEGRIESFEPVFLTAHGGDLNGMILVRGEEEKLAGLRRDSMFRKILVEGPLCLTGFGAIDGLINDGITDFLKDWTQFIKD